MLRKFLLSYSRYIEEDKQCILYLYQIPLIMKVLIPVIHYRTLLYTSIFFLLYSEQNYSDYSKSDKNLIDHKSNKNNLKSNFDNQVISDHHNMYYLHKRINYRLLRLLQGGICCRKLVLYNYCRNKDKEDIHQTQGLLDILVDQDCIRNHSQQTDHYKLSAYTEYS